MDRHGLDYPSKDSIRQPMWVEKVAVKSLYYLASLTSGTAYADELPLTSNGRQTDPVKTEDITSKTSWAERWAKSRAIVEETEQYDLHKLDRNFGSVMVGAGIGVGERAAELAGDLATAAVNLSMEASKFEQAYNPDHPKDLYSPQNEQLTAEVDRTRERGNATLHKIIDDPKVTSKAILHGMSIYFREGLADIVEQHRQGDYLGAGRAIGKIGLDAYLVTTGIHSLGIQALDLAIGASKVVSGVAKVAGRSALGALVDSAEVVAPRNSLLAFQYQSELRASILAEREVGAAAKGRARNSAGFSNSLNSKTPSLPEVIEYYLGKDFRMLKNKSGDPIFVNNNNTRRIRFDAQNPHGDIPHGHVEHYDEILGKWLDYTEKHRVYLKDALDYLHKPKPSNG